MLGCSGAILGAPGRVSKKSRTLNLEFKKSRSRIGQRRSCDRRSPGPIPVDSRCATLNRFLIYRSRSVSEPENGPKSPKKAASSKAKRRTSVNTVFYTSLIYQLPLGHPLKGSPRRRSCDRRGRFPSILRSRFGIHS